MDEAGTTGQRSFPEPLSDLSAEEIRNLGSSLHRTVRGYDPETVDVLLARIADRVAELEARDAMLDRRVNELAKKVFFHEGRAWAVQEALVAAHALRSETQDQASSDARATRAEADADAEAIRRRASVEARKLLSAARDEHARLTDRAGQLVASAESHAATVRAAAEADAARAREAADAYATSMQRDAERRSRQTRDRAIAEAASIMERGEAWTELMKGRAEAEADGIQEEALTLVRERRDAVVREVRMLRERADRDTERARRRAREVLEQAREDARLIREEIRREVQELRATAEQEASSVRTLAAADAERIRIAAEDAAEEIKEATRVDLLRVSTRLQVQIEERRKIIERLEGRRASLLARMQAMLLDELQAVERARASAREESAGSTADDHGAVVIGMSLDGAHRSSRGAGAPAAWRDLIDPETGQVVDAGHGTPTALLGQDGPEAVEADEDDGPPPDGSVGATAELHEEARLDPAEGSGN